MIEHLDFTFGAIQVEIALKSRSSASIANFLLKTGGYKYLHEKHFSHDLHAVNPLCREQRSLHVLRRKSGADS